MVESVGAHFGMIYAGWAAVCALVLVGIALMDYRATGDAARAQGD